LSQAAATGNSYKNAWCGKPIAAKGLLISDSSLEITLRPRKRKMLLQQLEALSPPVVALK